MKDKIVELCKFYRIEKYTINDDMTIDVDGDVNISNRGIEYLYLSFNEVHGDFMIYYNLLNSFKNFPKIITGSFMIYGNNISSLIGCPEYIGGNISAMFNQFNTRQNINLLNVYGQIHMDKNCCWIF